MATIHGCRALLEYHFLCLITLTLSGVFISVFPTDLVVDVEGDVVLLHCASNLSNSSIRWSWIPVPRRPPSVSSYTNGQPRDGRVLTCSDDVIGDYNHYQECNVTIERVRGSDAGTYTCVDRRSGHVLASVELIVVKDPRPVCRDNSSATGDDVIVYVHCRLSYSGNARPAMRWIDQKGRPIESDHVTVGNHGDSDYFEAFVESSVLIAPYDDDVSWCNCTAIFRRPFAGGATERASVIKSYTTSVRIRSNSTTHVGPNINVESLAIMILSILLMALICSTGSAVLALCRKRNDRAVRQSDDDVTEPGLMIKPN